MKGIIRTIAIGTGLTAIVGLCQLATRNESTSVVNRGTFPPTYLVDNNGDGSADEVKYFMVGNRVPHMFTRGPTEEERALYKERH